jgi:hypothetical protein
MDRFGQVQGRSFADRAGVTDQVLCLAMSLGSRFRKPLEGVFIALRTPNPRS